MADISKITIPNPAYVPGGGEPATLTYDIKDAVARAAIVAGFTFHLCTNAADTPYGVTWDDDGTLITGTLVASAETTGFYLVPSGHTSTKDIYDEYITALIDGVYVWERLGNTEIDFSNLASYLDADVDLTKDEVLGSATTFTAAASAVTFSGGTTDTFVKSYPGTTSKLNTTTVKGVGSDTTFSAVDGNTSVTATNTIFGTNTTASKITTASKTATNLVLGESTTASKVVEGTAVNVAKPASSATSVSYVGNASTSSLLESATVSNETLVLGSVAVSQGSVTGVNGTQAYIPLTITDVTVPVVTSNTSVTFDAVSVNTDVTVPVVTSNTEVTATNTTTRSVTAATSAANATTVATGSVSATGTGDVIMTGLGTPTTDTAIKTLGTGTAAAQSITVGANDKVNAVTDVDVTIINKAN